MITSQINSFSFLLGSIPDRYNMTRGVVFLVCIPTSNHEHELIFGVPIERGKGQSATSKQSNAVSSHPKLDLDLRHKRHPRDPLVVNKSKIDDQRQMSDFISMETVNIIFKLKINYCVDKNLEPRLGD